MHKLSAIVVGVLSFAALFVTGCAGADAGDAVETVTAGLTTSDVENELYSQWSRDGVLYTMHSFDVKGTAQRFACAGTFQGATAARGCFVEFNKDGIFERCSASACLDRDKRACAQSSCTPAVFTVVR